MQDQLREMGENKLKKSFKTSSREIKIQDNILETGIS